MIKNANFQHHFSQNYESATYAPLQLNRRYVHMTDMQRSTMAGIAQLIGPWTTWMSHTVRDSGLSADDAWAVAEDRST